MATGVTWLVVSYGEVRVDVGEGSTRHAAMESVGMGAEARFAWDEVGDGVGIGRFKELLTLISIERGIPPKHQCGGSFLRPPWVRIT